VTCLASLAWINAMLPEAILLSAKLSSNGKIQLVIQFLGLLNFANETCDFGCDDFDELP